MVEITDGTSEYNADYRRNVGFYYDLVKAAVERMALGPAPPSSPTPRCTAVAVTPGWLRSERMLEHFGVTEANWRDALAERAALLHLGVARRTSVAAMAALAGDPTPAVRRPGAVAAPNSPAPTASPTSTAPARTAGG